MNSKYTVVQSSVTEVRDPSLNLPQGGEIDSRLRINQPHFQAPPE
jgi:hypothetical protein